MPDNPQLAAFIDQLSGAVASGNMQNVQEAIREYNLSYANNVAQLYGQNWGPGQPAPIGASTLAAGQQFGSIGYIPGYSGIDAGQTMSQLAQSQALAGNAAGMTGFYAAPVQSQYSPGTFVRLDPNTYDTQQFGDVQISYVLPSGQLQRVSTTQAHAMGWNGDLGSMSTLPANQALMLERAPPSQIPQQTLQGLAAYGNLNAQAQNAALQQAGVTGYYQAPATVQPPGTDLFGHKFSDLSPETQQAYYMSNGSDWNAAMQKWQHDSNAQITQSYADRGLPPPGGAATPQMTTAYQEQLYRQQLDAINAAAQLQANPFRQAEVMGQLGGVLSGRGVAGFQAPGMTSQTDFSGMGNMQQMLNDIRAGGVQTGGGLTANGPAMQIQGQGQGQTGYGLGMGYFGTQQPAYQLPGGQGGGGMLQQTIDDIRGGTAGANSYGPQNVLNAIPTPNKLNSNEFFRSSPGTQQMILSGMQQKYGLAPTEALSQIKSTLPQFVSPTTFGSIKG